VNEKKITPHIPVIDKSNRGPLLLCVRTFLRIAVYMFSILGGAFILEAGTAARMP
jgi:hypothetical protein